MKRYSLKEIIPAIIVGVVVIATGALFVGTNSSTPSTKNAAVVKELQPFIPLALPTEGPAGTVYLSFDDGPDPVTTPQVLKVLSQFGARATFFVVGRYVDMFPNLVSHEYLSGHSVQNHTYDHHPMRGISVELFNYEVGRARNSIQAITGSAPGCVRAPYDDFDPEVVARLQANNMSLVGWTVDSDDWRKPGVDQIVQNVLNNIRPGGIILMHDAGGTDRSQTLAALQQIIPALRDRGYGFGLLCR